MAAKDDQVVGIGSLTEQGCLDLLVVDYAFQRRGIGRQLLNGFQHIAQACRITEIYADVILSARYFFYRQGFTALPCQPPLAENTGPPNICMVKQILRSFG